MGLDSAEVRALSEKFYKRLEERVAVRLASATESTVADYREIVRVEFAHVFLELGALIEGMLVAGEQR